MTAIWQVDLSEPLRDPGDLAGYDQCMVVARWHGRIVGRVFVPVVAGRVPLDRLERALAGGPAQEAVSRWIDETLNAPRPACGGTPADATVAICTRERPEELTRALQAVTALAPAAGDILVVDNAPASDATRVVASRFRGVRYVCEPRRGLNVARNRALHEARGAIVAFTDDDAVPEPQWLASLHRNFARPRVACATGLTLPLELQTEAQELFEEYSSFVRGFSRRLFDGCGGNPLAVGAVGAGANMAVRRETVLELGGFDERLDAGTATRSGGDHEIFARLLSAGYQIVYDPDAASWHRHRRTDAELLETIYGYGVGVYAMWTGLLVERGELDVFRLAWIWFTRGQLPAFLGRRRRGISRLARAELRGCVRGPLAWLAASRRPGEAGAC